MPVEGPERLTEQNFALKPSPDNDPGVGIFIVGLMQIFTWDRSARKLNLANQVNTFFAKLVKRASYYLFRRSISFDVGDFG
jgi:hypothetical protein